MKKKLIYGFLLFSCIVNNIYASEYDAVLKNKSHEFIEKTTIIAIEIDIRDLLGLPTTPLERIYKNLVNDNYDVGDFDKFTSYLKDSANVRKMYDRLAKDNYDVGDFDYFASKMDPNNQNYSSKDVATITNERLCKNLHKLGYQVGSYEEFNAKLKDSSWVRHLHGRLVDEGFVVGTFDYFASKVGLSTQYSNVNISVVVVWVIALLLIIITLLIIFIRKYSQSMSQQTFHRIATIAALIIAFVFVLGYIQTHRYEQHSSILYLDKITGKLIHIPYNED